MDKSQILKKTCFSLETISISMATITNLSGILESLTAIFNLHDFVKHRRNTKVTCTYDKNKKHELQEGSSMSTVQTTRRLALSFASIAIFGNATMGKSLAEDNGYWLTTPLPVPFANNEINNKETGTRSFLKKGIYIADIGTKGRMHRLKRYAFDLIALGDLIAQRDAWNYVRKYLRLKSTFMYFDFDEVISAAPGDDKQSLTNLAIRLFDSVEELLVAVKEQNYPKAETCYQATTSALEEVMIRMA